MTHRVSHIEPFEIQALPRVSVLFVSGARLSTDDIEVRFADAPVEVRVVRRGSDVAPALAAAPCDVVVCDACDPELDLTRIARTVLDVKPSLPVVLSGQGLSSVAPVLAALARARSSPLALGDEAPPISGASPMALEPRGATPGVLDRVGRLSAIGRMASGVTHELKNLLNPLSLHVQFVEHALKGGELGEATSSLAEMREILARGVRTIERLRAFARESDPLSKKVDLNQLAREASHLARPHMASQSGRLGTFRFELGEPPFVEARPGEVLGAIVALIVNAIEAMVAGGEVGLRTGALRNGAFVEVKDDGVGMSAELHDRIFEPFFTTKGDEGALGLGLTTAASVARRHGGTLTVDSALGRGTTCTLWLPASA